jgi:hypothetical protein
VTRRRPVRMMALAARRAEGVKGDREGCGFIDEE